MLDNNRLKRQVQAGDTWKNNNGIGTFEFVTGTGKTLTAILIIKRLLERNNERTIHVIVPRRELKKQWELELKTNKIKNTEVFVVNTYIKESRNCTLLVLDEIHNYASPKFSMLFKQTTYKFILGLTATMERKDMRHLLLQQKAPIIDTIDLQEAKDNSYVSDFIVYNLGLELTEEDRENYDSINKRFSKHFGVFGRDFKLAMACVSNKEIRRQYSQQMGWDEKSIGFHAVMFSKAMRERKDFLYNAQCKVNAAKEIIEKFKVKTITFSESTSFADKLTDFIPNSVSYHSNLKKFKHNNQSYGPTAAKRKVLSLFNDKRSKIKTLNTAKALDEGFDAKDLEMAIICSGTSTARQDIQRTGRVIRFKPDKIALVVNLYVKNSRDEDWLKQRQEKSTNVYWVNSIKEISYERPENVNSDTTHERVQL
jgi:superfamily II DNA or RNA helicase